MSRFKSHVGHLCDFRRVSLICARTCLSAYRNLKKVPALVQTEKIKLKFLAFKVPGIY